MRYNAYDISITTYCQLFCAGCQRNDEDNNLSKELVQEHMQYETFCMIMDQIDTMPVSHIQLCGELGDPMMHPDIDRILERILESNYTIMINTNGALRSPSWYTKWASNPKIKIYWGIDGLDHITNDKYRRGANFKKAWDNMSAWFKNKGKGEWHFILFSWNLHQVPEVARIGKEELNCKVLYKLTPSNTGKDGLTNEYWDQAKQLVDRYAT
tara:strand:+ start:1235 stop:1870 length:636 start_codon:yes stop_codon:yes gene_type:complete